MAVRMLILGMLGLVLCAGPAQAAYAPLDRPGPPLTVPEATLAAALHCSGPLGGTPHAPVLLSPGTGITPAQEYGFTYEPALNRLGIPWCAVTMPFNTLGDVQTAAEYLVHAIRTMHTAAARPIAIIGHSQGGMSMRWALRFWPDTRPMVDDVIGFAASNHGTTLVDAGGLCAVQCVPAVWQQRTKSAFIAALNSGPETFPGISYTNVYTHTDEVVTPNADSSGSSSLHTGGGRITNVAIQELCPADLAEHLLLATTDPVAYALAIDALTHDGPADPARVNRAVCSQLFQPGVDPATGTANLGLLFAAPGIAAAAAPVNAIGAPDVTSEPPLRCYVSAACPPGAPALSAPPTPPPAPHGRCGSARSFAIPLPRALHSLSASIGGRHLPLRRRRGRTVALVDLRSLPRAAVVVRIRGRTRGGALRVRTRRLHRCH
ncbi:MAG: hypothetical protein NVSMB51_13380 [Solirubrobacteraceae bacterium]